MICSILTVYATLSLTATQPPQVQPNDSAAEWRAVALLQDQDREVRSGWFYDYYYPTYPPTREQVIRARYGEERYPSREDMTDRERYPDRNDRSDLDRYPDRDDESDLDRYPSDD